MRSMSAASLASCAGTTPFTLACLREAKQRGALTVAIANNRNTPLLAEGATNRQIGTALFMAEKTASVHVSRILAKLGVRSRTQAAAVAHRMHLSR